MKAITIRNVDAALAKALARETGRRKSSLNKTVIDLLRSSLGINSSTPQTNGLEKLAGTWSAEEFDEFESEVAIFDQIDPELWR
jgi:hypothetical protein